MFKYNLLFNNNEVVVEFDARGMNSVIENFNLLGNSSAISVLKKRVNFLVTPEELLNKLNSFPHITVTSSVGPSSVVEEEVEEEVEVQSDSSDDSSNEEGSSNYSGGFRYSWSLDSKEDQAVNPSESNKDEEGEERVGD